MEKLWAPWRMTYIQEIGKDDECIFCTKPVKDADRENLILYRGRYCFIMMNLYPYNNGHCMIVPYFHTSECGALSDESALELWKITTKCKDALMRAFNPDGFNIGMNLGRTAGAGIDQHLHMHIVPRWNGDTNFMPVIGEIKVISQDIYQTYDALRPYFIS